MSSPCDTKKKNVVICGGGNGAHVLTSCASQYFNVRLLSLYSDEAARLKAALGEDELVAFTRDQSAKKDKDGAPEPETVSKSRPTLITNDAAEAFVDAHLVVFCVPSFSHRLYFESLLPHINLGLSVLGFPGGSGFEFEAIDVLGDSVHDITLASSESLPYACRIEEFGRKVEIIGFKNELVISQRVGRNIVAEVATPDTTRTTHENGGVDKRRRQPMETMLTEDILQKLVGPRCKPVIRGDILGLTLNIPNARIHVPVMYGKWLNWDGKPVTRIPLFYKEMTPEMVKIVSEIDEEVLKIAKAIKDALCHPSEANDAAEPDNKVRKVGDRPEKVGTSPKDIDLSVVTSQERWFMRVYGDQVMDKSSFHAAMTTSPAHCTIGHPMKEVGDKQWQPDFKHRFLTEEIPFSLVVIRGIADLVSVSTPALDRLILWAQEKIGKEYLTTAGATTASSPAGTKLDGKDLKETRAPQRYGWNKLSQIV